MLLASSVVAQDPVRITGERLEVRIDPCGFRFAVHERGGEGVPLLESHGSAGLEFAGARAVSCDPSGPTTFRVRNADGRAATVSFVLTERSVRLNIAVQGKAPPGVIRLRTGSIGPCYGLGDAGSYGPSSNLGAPGGRFDIRNDGGRRRWLTSFLIAPGRRVGGVVFSRRPCSVQVASDSWEMAISAASVGTFHYFFGDPRSIYAAYHSARHAAGYPDVRPQRELFELGWETWDALGWRTDEKTVKEYLTRFLGAGYPIRWAVTGSGFWQQGGTTTSFGDWNRRRYPDPTRLRRWLHERGIKWLIGQRTNFVALGGPHAPRGRRDRNASMAKIDTGPFTRHGLERGFFLRGASAGPLAFRSTVFPLVPCHLIDGSNNAASAWFAELFNRWQVDGVKEDTMMSTEDHTVFNGPMASLAANGKLVMSRCGAYSAPGTLSRVNDTAGVRSMALRTPVNYLQYAASAAPNVYSDTVGFGTMAKPGAANIRHAWLCALTAGMAMGEGPWTWPSDQRALLKKAVDFHYALGPYLYSAALETFETGYPATMTPLPIAYPDDPATAELASRSRRQYQWMIGDSLMAAPRLMDDGAGATMNVYLPRGTWVDYDTGAVHEGPATLDDFPMALGNTPVFVGGKGIVVLREPGKDALRVVVYPMLPKGETFTFRDGRGHPSVIRNAADGWNETTLVLVDVGSGRQVDVHEQTRPGSVLSFTLAPGRVYELRGGNP